MIQFIVLGIVPGTDFRLDFTLLAEIAAIGTVFYLAWLLYKERQYTRAQVVNFVQSISL